MIKEYAAIAGALAFAAATHADFMGLTGHVYVGDGWVENGYLGLDTYRIYANFDSEEDAVLAVYGSEADGPMSWWSWNGEFHNDAMFDSLTAPLNLTAFGYWDNQWDTYVTIDTDDADGDDTTLSPGFEEEVGGLAGDFVTSNAEYYVTPDDYPQGLADGFKVLIAQLTVDENFGGGSYDIPVFRVNLLFGDGSTIEGVGLPPAPGALGLLGIAALAGTRRRRA